MSENIKQKKKKIGFHQNLIFLINRRHYQENEKIKWEQIFANHLFDKGVCAHTHMCMFIQLLFLIA